MIELLVFIGASAFTFIVGIMLHAHGTANDSLAHLVAAYSVLAGISYIWVPIVFSTIKDECIYYYHQYKKKKP